MGIQHLFHIGIVKFLNDVLFFNIFTLNRRTVRLIVICSGMTDGWFICLFDVRFAIACNVVCRSLYSVLSVT